MSRPGLIYRIEAVRVDHDRSSFDCGHPFLNTYLTRFARQNDRNKVAKAYVMVPDATGNPVVGYYTLSASAVAFDSIPPSLRKRLSKHPVPVVRIGELAVNNAYKGQGLGSSLLLDAIRRIVRASTQIAIWSIVVDPLDQQAVSFLTTQLTPGMRQLCVRKWSFG